MAKFLITYDLKRPGQNYPKLYESIKQLGPWIHGMQNTWFVETGRTSAAIRDILRQHVDANDILFVVKVEAWASLNLPEAGWLKSEV